MKRNIGKLLGSVGNSDLIPYILNLKNPEIGCHIPKKDLVNTVKALKALCYKFEFQYKHNIMPVSSKHEILLHIHQDHPTLQKYSCVDDL